MELEWLGESTGRYMALAGSGNAGEARGGGGGGRQPPRVSSGLCRVTFLPPSPGYPLPCQVIQPFIASSLLCDPHTPTEQRLPGEEGRLLAFLVGVWDQLF